MRPVMPRVRNWSRSALCCAFVWAAPAAAETTLTQTTTPAPVKVERVKPHTPKLPTLRFLRTNRDFVRGRLDLLRERGAGAQRAEDEVAGADGAVDQPAQRGPPIVINRIGVAYERGAPCAAVTTCAAASARSSRWGRPRYRTRTRRRTR